jgi:hypothetical protein
MTPDEQRALDLQAHFEFKDLSPGEQQRIQADIASMWAQIPSHLHEKAKNIKEWKRVHGG